MIASSMAVSRCRLVQTQTGEWFFEIIGSPYYMAPEVLKQNYDPEIDIWSARVILYILLCGVPSFWAESEQGVAQAILRGTIDFKRDTWPNISEGAKSLVRQILEADPKKRLTTKQLLEDTSCTEDTIRKRETFEDVKRSHYMAYYYSIIINFYESSFL